MPTHVKMYYIAMIVLHNIQCVWKKYKQCHDIILRDKIDPNNNCLFSYDLGEGGEINPTLLRAALYQNTVTRRPINLLHKAVLFS